MHRETMFQSRNRDAFLFKYPHYADYIGWLKFQSRNRDAFLFKTMRTFASVSSGFMFQSRNRDAFLFKSQDSVRYNRHRKRVSIS